MRDVDWDGSLGKLRSRDGFQKLKAADATGPYKGLFAHSSQRMLAVKRVSGASVKIVALDSFGAEKVEATWTATAAKSCFARYGTPSASYTYCRANISTHKVVRFDGTAFTEPTATVNGVAGKEMPRGALMVTWPDGDNRLVVANTANGEGPGGAASSGSHVWFSDPGSAESWHTVAPEANFVQLSPGDGEEITAMAVYGGQVFVFKQTKFFVFYGVSVDSEGGPEFNFREVSLGDGSQMRRAASAELTETSDQLATTSPTGVYFCTTDGVYVTTGGGPQKISQALRPLEEVSPFDGPMAEFLNGATETCRWPAAGIIALGQRLVVKRYEYLFIYDIPTNAWTCWRMTSVSLAVWTGLSGGGSEALTGTPSTVVDNNTEAEEGTTAAWSNPGNAKVIDSVYSTVNVVAAGVTHLLKATGLGLAVPETATIVGVVVGCRRHQAGSERVVQDFRVSLVKAGVLQAENKKSLTPWENADTTQTYGGAADLWGTTLTPAQVNAANFGVGLQVYNVIGVSNEALVDGFIVTVYYTLPESSSGARPRLFATSGKSVYWTGPAAEEQAGLRTPEYQIGFYDLGSEDEKTLEYMKVWGSGNISIAVAKDFGPVGAPKAFKLGVAPAIAQARSNMSATATLHSHRLSGAAPWSIQRVVRYLRETRVAGTKTK